MTGSSRDPGGTLLNAVDFPAETLRLVSECRDTLQRSGVEWADWFAGVVRRSVESRAFEGVLWAEPGGDAVALAEWEKAGERGRRGWIYVAEGYQRASVFTTFLRRLDTMDPAGLPLLSCSPDLPGVPDSDRDAVFRDRGFLPVSRCDMIYPRNASLPAPLPAPGQDARSLTLADKEGMAKLDRRAYADNPIDRGLFTTALDELEDARRAIASIVGGRYGRWLPEASFGIEQDGRLVALTLANDFQGALISDVAVDPAYRGKGLASRLLYLTVGALRSAGFEDPRLVVTMQNRRAVRLYQRLGFQFVPGGSGRSWLNARALGISPSEFSAD